MKNIFKFQLILSALFLLNSEELFAQIPNPGFESWDSVTLQQPSGYRVYGSSRKVSGYMSPSAVRLQRDRSLSAGPGAVIYGNPDENFSGGIPVSARPDSAVAFFRYHLPPGDSAWYLVFLKRNGAFISQDVFRFTGSDSTTFRRMAFAIGYQDTGLADSLVIGIASTNPDEDFEGGFVVADSLHFTGGIGSITVPNGNFEQWNTVGFNNPVGWTSTNTNAMGLGAGVRKSTDRAEGAYACRIENLSAGNGKFLQGYIMAGRQGSDGPEPGFRVTGRDSILYFSYKCFPAGGDTVNVAILMYKGDTMIGTGNFRQSFTINAWSLTAVPISYWSQSVPDSAVIYCAAFLGGSEAKGNSVLYVDGFSLNKPYSSIRDKWKLPLRVVPNPAGNRLSISHPEISEGATLIFTDIGGRVLQIKPEISKAGLIVADISSLAPGLWTFTVQGTGAALKGRVMIAR